MNIQPWHKFLSFYLCSVVDRFYLFSFCFTSCLVPAPAPLLDANKYLQRPSLQRPFSFTHGVVPEATFSQALGAQFGIVYLYFA